MAAFEYNDMHFNSIAEFVRYYGLNYPTATAQLRRGFSFEDVINAHHAAQTRKERTESSSVCSYNGKIYESLSAAAEDLGIAASLLYTIRKQKQLSSNDTIVYAMEHRNIRRGEGKKQSCIINGVQYPSRKAALEAYKINNATVFSRMQRKGISFEEAVLQGVKERKRLNPIPKLFCISNFQLTTEKEIGEPLKDKYASLCNKLYFYGYSPVFYQIQKAKDSNAFAVQVEDTFGGGPTKRTVKIYLCISSYSIEIVIPELLKNINAKDICFYEKLNQINQSIPFGTIYIEDAQAVLKHTIYNNKVLLSGTYILGTFLSLLNAIDNVYDKLIELTE